MKNTPTGDSKNNLIQLKSNQPSQSGLRAVNEMTDVCPPSPEVQGERPRRRFTAAYKLSVLEALDRCATASERGSIMRQEGLYSSRISEWRKARRNGSLSALKRLPGRKIKYDEKDKKINALQTKVDALEKQLSQAEAILDVQKKVCEIFGVTSPSSQKDEVKSWWPLKS